MIKPFRKTVVSLRLWSLSCQALLVTNPIIPKYAINDSNSKNITDSIKNIILKYRNHPSIFTIGEVRKGRFTGPFSFPEVCKEEILKYILNFDTSNPYQDTDVPTRDVKKNSDIFAEFLHFSYSINLSKIINFQQICFKTRKHNTSF